MYQLNLCKNGAYLYILCSKVSLLDKMTKKHYNESAYLHLDKEGR